MKKLSILSVCLVVCLLAIAAGFFLLQEKTTPPAELITDEPQPLPQFVVEPSISILPETIMPGNPVLITIKNATSSVVEMLFDTKKIPVFMYNNEPRGLIGIDFNAKAATHTVRVTFSNGSVLEKRVVVTPRPKIERPLGIPEKLGGNTPQAAQNLVSNLATENAVLNKITSTTTILWTNTFASPLENIFVTDDYGYNRNTVNTTIVHKGTDFRAPVGTEVKAMNDGVVKIARTFIVYGNTIVVDHGLGLQTLYMHLSKLNVVEGDTVRAGQVIGYSGQTGYADQPHLHVSIRIFGISIDPMVFMGFFTK